MDSSLHASIRTEGQSLYYSTAQIVAPVGTPKKRLDELVSKAWGDYPLWRVRACRLGEAGPFSAAAVRWMQREYLAFMERHRAKTESAAATEQARQAAADRALLLRLRDQHAAELRKLNARLALLDGGSL